MQHKTGGLTHIFDYICPENGLGCLSHPNGSFPLFCDKIQTPPTADDGRLYQLFVAQNTQKMSPGDVFPSRDWACRPDISGKSVVTCRQM